MNPILVALDMADIKDARQLAERLLGKVGGFKVGLELIMAEGPKAIDQIASLGSPVFADVKLSDIPNTVQKASLQLAKHGARWVTVHASGGGEMISAAVAGLEEGAEGRQVGVLAVTVLTSLDSEDLHRTGIARSLDDQIEALSTLAAEHAAEGVVCSPREASIVKRVSADLLAVTPGIRLSSGQPHDQKRVATPVDAIGNGADLLVIGRAITNSSDPIRVVDEINSALHLESPI